MFTRTKQNPVLLRGLFIYFGLKIEAFDMLFVENRPENRGVKAFKTDIIFKIT